MGAERWGCILCLRERTEAPAATRTLTRSRHPPRTPPSLNAPASRTAATAAAASEATTAAALAAAILGRLLGIAALFCCRGDGVMGLVATVIGWLVAG